MKTSPLPARPSPLTTQLFTDIHCHLLPQIDDGPKDWEASLAMARLAVANGIRTIVATPHQLGRYEKNSTDQILQLTAEAQQRVTQAGLSLTILPGGDVRIQEDLPELVERGQVLTLGGRRTRIADRPLRIEDRGSSLEDSCRMQNENQRSKIEDRRSTTEFLRSSILHPRSSILVPFDGVASRSGPTHRPVDLPTSMSGRHMHCVASGAKSAFAAESGHPSAVGAAGLPHSSD